MKIKTAIIGFGRMGRFYLKALQKNPLYSVNIICDIDEACLRLASELVPETRLTRNVEDVMADRDIDLVVLSALAGGRYERIAQALNAGKHIIAEKPLAANVEQERKVLEVESRHPDLFCAVNLYLRNSWYHNTMRAMITPEEIGELGIIRICHMTPGLAPGEGHEDEGPCFHDCGMHYCDLARWYSGSKYATCHAQGIRMWGYKDPWWVQCHGTFENGIVYDITQGFVYGQMSKDQICNSYVELIGSLGFCRFTHDFKNAVIDFHGVNHTERIERPCGGKNIDVMIEKMAMSILSGVRNPELPRFSDAAIASEFSWHVLDLARENSLPIIGNNEELKAIRHRRSLMTEGEGFGVLPKNRVKLT